MFGIPDWTAHEKSKEEEDLSFACWFVQWLPITAYMFGVNENNE